MSKSFAEKPQFPIRILWCETGEVEYYEDEVDLLQNLEDFDSNKAVGKNAANVTDALGRPVKLLVRIYDGVCDCSLDQS